MLTGALVATATVALSTVALSTAALRTATVALNISFYDNKFIS